MSDDSFDLLDDEGSGYLISISDVMSGLLFVFMITLVAFIIKFQSEKQLFQQEKFKLESVQEEQRKQLEVQKVITSRLQNNFEVRRQLLRMLQKKIMVESGGSINVTIDENHGVLRLDENSINFNSGSAELNQEQLARLMIIRNALEEVLPCYTHNPEDFGFPIFTCNSEVVGKLDSVFIEGHTDNVPIGKGLRHKFKDNWSLASARANHTFRVLLDFQPVTIGTVETYSPEGLLSQMLNERSEPIFSVASYGEFRPITAQQITPEERQANRRIDLRFIMTPPTTTMPQLQVQEKLAL